MTGTVKVKNVSGAPYFIDEMDGLEVADQATIDLLDPTLTPHYVSWDAANRLVTELTTAKFYQDIQAGKLTVIENMQLVLQLLGP